MNDNIIDLARKRTVLMDGAMGTELMSRSLPQDACPEVWNMEKPEIVQEVHLSYYKAGSDVVTTNSFGGNRLKLAAHGLESRAYELNCAAAALARAVKPAGKFVAGSIGPTGKLLKPQGDYTEEQFEAVFSEQAQALTDGGVDFLLIETMYDLREAMAALHGARRISPLPVFVTLTFNRTPRGYFTFMGNSVAQCVLELEKADVAAYGANCMIDSRDMVGLVRAFREKSYRPIIAQANAGKPEVCEDGSVKYSQGIDDYVRFIPDLVKAGANFVGGCCGTNPAYIQKAAAALISMI
ncbi:MAG: homocysteine S-methyltransferase family protein [Acidobacteriota bacterium]|nr:homocysteine S-methyltransferase family protein [Acidobacteriota bacterium]